jgi:glycosyltransferase involved in cell wall biosynthesis
MELADLVLVPSSFVANTIRAFHPEKTISFAPYGVDLEFWKPGDRHVGSEVLRFIYAGQLSLRKGIPDLLQAWEKAAVRDAELTLVGSWFLNERKRATLPQGVKHVPALSSEGLRDQYHKADIFVFPSFFEGFGLVLLEAMACGLPAIATDATAGADVLTEASGRLLPVGNQDALVSALRWFDQNRGSLPAMSCAARKQAELCTWERYRRSVTEATARFV